MTATVPLRDGVAISVKRHASSDSGDANDQMPDDRPNDRIICCGTLTNMTIDAWLKAAIADAERRGLPLLKPLLEGWRSRRGCCAARTSRIRGGDSRPQIGTRLIRPP